MPRSVNKSLSLALFCLVAFVYCSQAPKPDPRLANAFRNPPQNNWVYVHLQGTPSDIGYQNGYLLATEISDLKQVDMVEEQHNDKKDWNWLRQQAQTVMWPKIEPEYQQEMQGIADGVTARGGKLDVWDVVAMNAMLEWSYYVEQWNKDHGAKGTQTALLDNEGDHCSAFVATGKWTRDGKIVMAHNDWTSYLDGARWNIIYDIQPSNGQHFMMDGLPGVIHSADDFGVNASGIMITETTISDFHGYDFNGVPEFVRARKAMQYATSIDEFAKIMEAGNNGGYANDWLVADRKTNEIASLELGLKNVTLDRSKNGYFVSSNFPINPKLTKEETTFNVHDLGASANARHVRWLQLMAQYKGKIDVAAAQKFEADHYDTFLKKDNAPSERTLCGHHDLSPRGETPYNDSGAVQNKAIDSDMAAKMEFTAASGHACGMNFNSAAWLAAHPQFAWQKSVLKDMDAFPWTTITAGEAKSGQ
ncbi:MAG TPA: C45 family peptidase [Terriglobales bacterium]|nr:C45 family peptidase [Terriglobales bacterium]